jgi:hypothetical protein
LAGGPKVPEKTGASVIGLWEPFGEIVDGDASLAREDALVVEFMADVSVKAG